MKKYPLLLSLCCSLVWGQSTVQKEGLRENTPAVHAITNITIVPSPGKRIESGTIVIRDGVIQAAGANAAVPADARVWDGKGLTAYYGMIDLYSDYGQPKPRPAASSAPAAPEPVRGANYWNNTIKSENSSADMFAPEKESGEKLRAAGFTTVLSVPLHGIVKGTSALVNTGDGSANDEIVNRELFHHATVVRDNFGGGYPNSLMGQIALLRQTLSDARWYADARKVYAKNPNQPKPEENATLAALEAVAAGKQKMVFDVNDELSALRAAAVAKEFSVPYLLRGSGYEYRRLDAVKGLSVPVILPVNFPDAPAVETPEDELNASYEDLRHWDFAAENPARMKKAGITVAFTAHQLKEVAKFRSMIATAIAYGLNADDALAGVTTVPAQIAGMEKQLGTIEAGKIANLVIADGELFSDKSKIRETWVAGKRYPVAAAPSADLRGTWSFVPEGKTPLTLEISGEIGSPGGSILSGGKKAKLNAVTLQQKLFSFSFDGDSLGLKGVTRVSGAVNEKSIAGLVEYADGTGGTWKGELTKPFTSKQDSAVTTEKRSAANEVVYPDGAYGRKEIPAQQDLLIKNATIWTSGPQGILENSDLLIVKGKIAKIGKGLTAPGGAVTIEANGKHVTPGLIDAHSHAAVAGAVNESGQAITAEVRIGDVINADDINIYRQLAGGLTVANILHGSANAIGGQNQVIKLRWGLLPEQLKFEGAIPGIKFALGENPKQSNWGDNNTTRYPQTRMGVEQIIRDEFIAAKEYDRMMKEKPNPAAIPPRRDLELEAIAEILNKQRLVHAHSYRQDEILMLLKVSDDFQFQIGTLQHVLEGYKVADEIAKRGVGASCFSDWWAYKYEVVDAIPYAGKLMYDAGVLVSYNSDSNEMARRMNLEAAKATKYGGVNEADALKFVTINPAKQLRIDQRVGSLEVGKDGDVVLWSGHPFSTYTSCEQTWIDGRKYFDKAEDEMMRQDVAAKKSALVQKALSAKKRGSGLTAAAPSRTEEYSCHESTEGGH